MWLFRKRVAAEDENANRVMRVVAALQELQSTHALDYIAALKPHGYDGFYAPKTFLPESPRRYKQPEIGNAVLWRTDRVQVHVLCLCVCVCVWYACVMRVCVCMCDR